MDSPPAVAHMNLCPAVQDHAGGPELPSRQSNTALEPSNLRPPHTWDDRLTKAALCDRLADVCCGYDAENDRHALLLD